MGPCCRGARDSSPRKFSGRTPRALAILCRTSECGGFEPSSQKVMCVRVWRVATELGMAEDGGEAKRRETSTCLARSLVRGVPLVLREWEWIAMPDREIQ